MFCGSNKTRITRVGQILCVFPNSLLLHQQELLITALIDGQTTLITAQAIIVQLVYALLATA